jgi:hypothetical protein
VSKLALFLFCSSTLLTTCVDLSPHVRQSMPIDAIALADAAQVTQGTGITAPVTITDSTGIAVQSALPLGQLAVMALVIWLSHRRESQRIAQPVTLICPHELELRAAKGA